MKAAQLSAIVAAAILAGCASPPVHFHTLVPLPEVTSVSRGQQAIEVETVTVPPQVDRSELVVRQGESGLAILSSDWWGSSPSEEIRSALAAYFAPSAEKEEALALAIEVTRFDAVPGQYAVLEAEYRLTRYERDERVRIGCTTRLRTGASEKTGSLVRAQQENVRHLADEIMQIAVTLASQETGDAVGDSGYACKKLIP